MAGESVEIEELLDRTDCTPTRAELLKERSLRFEAQRRAARAVRQAETTQDRTRELGERLARYKAQQRAHEAEKAQLKAALEGVIAQLGQSHGPPPAPAEGSLKETPAQLGLTHGPAPAPAERLLEEETPAQLGLNHGHGTVPAEDAAPQRSPTPPTTASATPASAVSRPIAPAQLSRPSHSRQPRFMRRRTRRWTEEETAAFISRVHKYGKGQWKCILDDGGPIFKDRSQVDLKDKWRNLEKHGKVTPAHAAPLRPSPLGLATQPPAEATESSKRQNMY